MGDSQRGEKEGNGVYTKLNSRVYVEEMKRTLIMIPDGAAGSDHGALLSKTPRWGKPPEDIRHQL